MIHSSSPRDDPRWRVLGRRGEGEGGGWGGSNFDGWEQIAFTILIVSFIDSCCLCTKCWGTLLSEFSSRLSSSNGPYQILLLQPEKVTVPVQTHSGAKDTFKGFADPATVKPWWVASIPIILLGVWFWINVLSLMYNLNLMSNHKIDVH